MRIITAALVLPLYLLATACGGGTTPEGPSPLQLETPLTANITLSGTVRDAENSAPLPEAEVLIVSGPDITRSTLTDPSGGYALTGLRLGAFSVRFTRPGYEIAERLVSASGDARLDLQLRRGPSCRALPPPSGFRTQVGTSRIVFSWSPVDGRYDYLLRVGTASGSYTSLERGVTGTSYTWDRVRPGTYYARVGTRSPDCPHTDFSREITVTVGQR